MKILYAIQGTGNGHLSRASEIAPYLAEQAEVDFLLSGRSAELSFPFPFKYSYHGLSYKFGTRGGIDYVNSIRSFKPIQLFKDIITCPVEHYDVVINDFEPISAWAAKKKKIPVIALSHQASFMSKKVPLPKYRNVLLEYLMRRVFAPSDDFVGLHYQAYDHQVMPPIIRNDLPRESITDTGHITVYLPAFADAFLINAFRKLPKYNWEIFTKKTNIKSVHGNVKLFPVDKTRYSQSLLSCHGLLTGGGFQATSEALWLKKKLLVIPMYNQYEQKCNAKALQIIGVDILKTVNHTFIAELKSWIEKPSRILEPPQKAKIQDIANTIFSVAEKLLQS